MSKCPIMKFSIILYLAFRNDKITYNVRKCKLFDMNIIIIFILKMILDLFYALVFSLYLVLF